MALLWHGNGLQQVCIASTLPAWAYRWSTSCRCEYPVSDRANAVRQFFEAAERDPMLIKVQGLHAGALL